MRKQRNPWDDSFWMATPAWYPTKGATLKERVPPPVIAYLLVAVAAFALGLMIGLVLR